MIQLTPSQRKQAAKMLATLEDMSARSTQMIELVNSMIDHRAKAHNDKVLWLLDHRPESTLKPISM